MTTKRRKPKAHAPKAAKKPVVVQSVSVRLKRIERRLDRLERTDRRITGFEQCIGEMREMDDEDL